MKNSLVIPSIIAKGFSDDSAAPTLTWYTNKEGATLDTGKNLSSSKLVEVYKDGLLLQDTVDYTISDTTITFTSSLTTSNRIAVKIYGEGESSEVIEVISDEDGNIVISKSDMTVESIDGNVTLSNIEVQSDTDGQIVLE